MANENKQIDPTVDKVSKAVAIAFIIGLLAIFGVITYKIIEWIVGL